MGSDLDSLASVCQLSGVKPKKEAAREISCRASCFPMRLLDHPPCPARRPLFGLSGALMGCLRAITKWGSLVRQIVKNGTLSGQGLACSRICEFAPLFTIGSHYLSFSEGVESFRPESRRATTAVPPARPQRTACRAVTRPQRRQRSCDGS